MVTTGVDCLVFNVVRALGECPSEGGRGTMHWNDLVDTSATSQATVKVQKDDAYLHPGLEFWT